MGVKIKYSISGLRQAVTQIVTADHVQEEQASLQPDQVLSNEDQNATTPSNVKISQPKGKDQKIDVNEQEMAVISAGEASNTEAAKPDVESAEVPQDTVAPIPSDDPQAGPSTPVAAKPSSYVTQTAALSVAYGGYVMGIGLVLKGAFGSFISPLDNVMQIAGYGLAWAGIGYVALIFGYWTSNRLLWRRATDYEITTNLAAAIVESCGYLSSGLLVAACLDGNSQEGQWRWAQDILTFVIFFSMAQITLILIGFFFFWVTAYNDQQQVKSGNVAAGVSFGMHLVACSILMASPLNKTTSMLAFWVFFICSFVLMHMGRLIYQKPCKLIREVDREVAEDRNWGVALVEGCILISIALAYSTFLRDAACSTPVATSSSNSMTAP
jgi:uncharacterized membrane protein YjfL (UPF0719 family)